MDSKNKIKLIQQFIEGINRRDLAVIDRYLDRDFFNYSPQDNEETAIDITHQFIGDFLNAFPDLEMYISDIEEDGDNLILNLSASGTRQNDLWGAPGSGKKVQWNSSVTCRFSRDKFAYKWKELSMPEILDVMRDAGIVPPPEDMDKPPEYPIILPEFLLKVLFTGQVAEKECSHLDMIQVVKPDTDVCRDCIALGDVWPALRMCLICGYVGCCDTSKNKLMKRHITQSGHALFRSIRLDESWVWCNEDAAFFSGKILDKYQ